MKKVIITFIFLLGLIPLIKNGEISLIAQSAFGQNEDLGNESIFDPDVFMQNDQVHSTDMGDITGVLNALPDDFLNYGEDQKQSSKGSCAGKSLENMLNSANMDNQVSENDIMNLGALMDGRSLDYEKEHGISTSSTEWIINFYLDTEPLVSNDDIYGAIADGIPILASKKTYDENGNLIVGMEHEIDITGVDTEGNFVYFDTQTGKYKKVIPSDVTHADAILGVKVLDDL